MAQHPTPVYDNELVLVQQPLQSTNESHTAIVTCAFHDLTAQGPQEAADRFQASWNANIAALLSDTVTSQKPTVLYGTGDDVPQFAVGSAAPAVGAVAASYPPSQVSLLVKKTTLFTGRLNRGRMYIPFAIAEADVGIGGIIGGGVLATFQAAFNSFKAAQVGNSFPPIISNKTLATDPVTLKKYVTEVHIGAVVTSLQCETFVATQRRRLARG